MTFQVQPEIPIFVGILLVTLSLFTYGLQQYHQRGKTPELLAFIVLLFVICFWQLTAIFINAITVPDLILAGNNFGNAVLVPSFTYSMAWFALTYTDNNRWVNRWTGGLALVTILLTSLILLFNPELMIEANGLTTQGPITIAGITFPEWVVLDLTLKPAYRVFVLYHYLIIVLSGAILARYLLTNRGEIYTGQAIGLVTGGLTPVAVNTLLFLGIMPPEWNLTHVGFGITAIAFSVTMFRYKLFRVPPLGRQQLVEQLSDPVIMLDENQSVVDCNQAALELVETPEGWRGMSAAEFFAPFNEDVEVFTTPESDEIRFSNENTERIFTVESLPVENNRRKQQGRLIQLTEVTEERAREKQLREQNERLDEFASIVSHDLQSPINVAKARLKLAKQEHESEQLEEIGEALTRMESLIDDMLSMSRNRQSTQEPEPVSVEKIAKTAWTYSDIDDCSLQLTIPQGCVILADRNRLLQVFQNLYTNAVEHNTGHITVEVGILGSETSNTESDDRSGFYVSDDGSGIPEKLQDDLFRRGSTTNANGTGYGLAIVQEIVTDHDWEITVTDSEDGGARFEIRRVEFKT